MLPGLPSDDARRLPCVVSLDATPSQIGNETPQSKAEHVWRFPPPCGQGRASGFGLSLRSFVPNQHIERFSAAVAALPAAPPAQRNLTRADTAAGEQAPNPAGPRGWGEVGDPETTPA